MKKAKSKRENMIITNIIEKIHLMIIALYIASVCIIIFSDDYWIYGLIFIVIVWILQLIFGRICPLTLLDNNLRKETGEYIHEEGFIYSFIKNRLKINMPLILLKFIIRLIFIIIIIGIAYRIYLLK